MFPVLHIKQVIMDRDGMSEKEADKLIAWAKDDLMERLERGEMPYDLCEEWFGLEPDYLDELMF